MKSFFRLGLKRFFPFFILFVLFLAGCTATTEEDDTIQPLSIVSLSPEKNAQNVPITSSLNITFSHEMLSSSVSVNVTDSSCLGTIQVSTNNFSSCIQMTAAPFTLNSLTYTITPNVSLESFTTHSIKISRLVQDTRDVISGSDYLSPFKTAQLDTDGDGTPDTQDTDDDNDGVLDTSDAFPLDNSETVDTDGDGTGNNTDTDDDGDGVLDTTDAFPLDKNETTDTDSDGIGNHTDTDDDGDGVADSSDIFPLDNTESVDTDGDKIGNNTDTDDDGDGVLDTADAFPLDNTEAVDTDGDLTGNNADTDDDGDGVLDTADAFPLDKNETTDTDGDGIGNNSDTDDDGDGIEDTVDNQPLNANQAPIVESFSISMAEDNGPLSITLKATDAENDSMTYTIASNASKGNVVKGSGAAVSYTPNSNYNGADQFTYTASDGRKTSSVGTVQITITPVNDAPTISGTAGTTILEDTAYSFTPSATDVDGDTLTYTIQNRPSWSSFSSSTGSLTGTPQDQHVGSTSGIVISVSDGTDSVSLDPFNIEVTNANDPPTVSNVSTTIAEDSGPTSITLLGTDIDEDAMTYSLASSPSNGTLGTLAGNTLSYTPSNDFNGTDTFTYTASDGTATSSPGTVSVIVTPVNDAPTLTGTPSTSTNEDEPYSFIPTSSDIDGDPLTFSIQNKPSWATFSTATGALTGTPANQNVGTYSGITIAVTDGTVSQTLSPFNLTVVNVNDPPTVSAVSQSMNEDSGALSITLSGSDDDGDSLTYSIASSPQNGTLGSVSGSTVTYTPTTHYNGTDTFTYTASDGTASSDSAVVTITVIPVNDDPTISGTPATSIDEDTAYIFTPTGADVDNDTLTYSITNKPSWATFNTASGILSGTPENEHVGSFSGIVITVTDSQSASASLASFSIAVNNVNDAPTVQDVSGSGNEDTTISITLNGNDIDVGDSLSYKVVANPQNGSVSISGSVASYSPNANYNGSDSFRYAANDGTVDSTAATASITILPVNDAPVAQSASYTVTTYQEFSIDLSSLASDVDGDSLTYGIQFVDNSTSPATIRPEKGVVNFAPNSSTTVIYQSLRFYTGADAFIYTVSDGTVSVNAQINLTIQ